MRYMRGIHRDIQQLATSLALVLSEPSKMHLLHEVCQLLPASDQAAFDRVAASVVAEGEYFAPQCSHVWCTTGAPSDTDDVEMLYRVQGGSLPQEGERTMAV